MESGRSARCARERGIMPSSARGNCCRLALVKASAGTNRGRNKGRPTETLAPVRGEECRFSSGEGETGREKERDSERRDGPLRGFSALPWRVWETCFTMLRGPPKQQRRANPCLQAFQGMRRRQWKYNQFDWRSRIFPVPRCCRRHR